MDLQYTEKVKEINQGKNQKYYILTMGCSLNENDSEKLSGMLEEMRYTKTDSMEEADFIIFNTCCVRENAEERLFGKIGEVKKQKEKRDVILAIGGCMMQEKHITQKLKKSYPFINILFGTHTLQNLPKDVYQILQNRKRIEDILDIDGEIIEGLPIKRNDTIKASVTIMNGCNNFCSYCIVPYVRGRERSRKVEDILKEVEGLAKEGYKEITLLGQNVNSYMRSENEKGNIPEEKRETFATLLRKVNEIQGIERIRFISPHPKDFTEDVIEAIRDCEKVCKCIHLPLQSGSSNILKVMNRKYTKEQYLDLVEKMKKNIPDLTLTTDIIVGFPGETEEDFEETLDVVRKVKFEQAYMFIYSRRVGTPGDKMENQVPEEIKHKRFDILKKLVDSQVEENSLKYIGTIQKVLIEGTSKNNENTLTGRTESNKIVILELPENEEKESIIKNIVDIEIKSQHRWYLSGNLSKK